MFRVLAILAIGLGLGGGIGFLVAAANGFTLGGHDHGAHAQATEMGHNHTELLDVPQAEAPTVTLDVRPDLHSGWNLHLKAENFRFAPENAGRAHLDGQRHGHVYVDGEKIARLYGNWMYFRSLPVRAEVKVTLNTNDHCQLSSGGQPIAAVVTVHEAR
jgi:hypothetical protein